MKLKLFAVIIIINILFTQTVFSIPIKKVQVNKDSILICNYVISDLKGWKSQNLNMALFNKITSLRLKKKSMDAVILCVRKSVTMDQWISGTKMRLPGQFREYALLKEYSSTFHGKNAYWFIYKGKTYGKADIYKGQLLIVDMGNKGFIVSMACPEKDYEKNLSLFKEVTELFEPID